MANYPLVSLSAHLGHREEKCLLDNISCVFLRKPVSPSRTPDERQKEIAIESVECLGRREHDRRQSARSRSLGRPHRRAALQVAQATLPSIPIVARRK